MPGDLSWFSNPWTWVVQFRRVTDSKGLQRPIPFSGPMVRAILEGRKTQTRRPVRVRDLASGLSESCVRVAPMDHYLQNPPGFGWFTHAGLSRFLVCPYGQSGDRLRVKEAAWMWCERRPNGTTRTDRQKWSYVPLRAAPVHYHADHPERPTIDVVSPETGNRWGWRYKAARFLPAWASRLTLEVVSVRVERLQEISEEDIVAEGCTVDVVAKMTGTPWGDIPDLFTAWRLAWDSINGARAA